MRGFRQAGITFLELTTAIAILMILLGVGVPSFISVVKNSRISSGYQSLSAAVFLARSEAVKRSGHVSVCARANDERCGNDWNNGWLVYVENFNGGTIGVRDDDEDLLLIQSPVNENIVIQATGRSIQASSSTAQDYLLYTNRGSTNWQGGTFTICDDRGPEHAMAINIVLTGDVRRARAAEGSPVPLDVNGLEVQCP